MAENTTAFDAAMMAQLTENRANVRTAMFNAVSLHRDNIDAELCAIAAYKLVNPARFARKCVINAILSAGADLEANFAATRRVMRHLDTSGTATITPYTSTDGKSRFTTNIYDISRDISDGGRAYGGLTVGGNCLQVAKQWDTLASLQASDMTLPRLKKIGGLGDKTARWALAPFAPSSRIITIDRHMLKGFASLCGHVITGNMSISAVLYRELESFVLSVYDEVFSDDDTMTPLCAQWSLWNEFRHSGKHATHLGLIA